MIIGRTKHTVSNPFSTTGSIRIDALELISSRITNKTIIANKKKMHRWQGFVLFLPHDHMGHNGSPHWDCGFRFSPDQYFFRWIGWWKLSTWGWGISRSISEEQWGRASFLPKILLISGRPIWWWAVKWTFLQSPTARASRVEKIRASPLNLLRNLTTLNKVGNKIITTTK